MQACIVHAGASETVCLDAHVCAPMCTQTHIYYHYHNHSNSL